jgi:predicted NUDIX family NTP pyrophosphohydrolase
VFLARFVVNIKAKGRCSVVSKQSAGILLYRINDKNLEVFLVHPGGPFWAKKDQGAWSIPKGEFDEEEEGIFAAKREFLEETGMAVEGEAIPLSPQKQKGGKLVYAWAVEGNLDPAEVRSNTFEMEWPPRSGRLGSFPEIDRAGWFPVEEALRKINAG